MSEQAVPEREPDRRTGDRVPGEVVPGDVEPADAVPGEVVPGEVVPGDDPGSYTGQVLGQSVPIPPEAAVAGPASPETGAVRDEEGRPTTEKPYP